MCDRRGESHGIQYSAPAHHNNERLAAEPGLMQGVQEILKIRLCVLDRLTAGHLTDRRRAFGQMNLKVGVNLAAQIRPGLRATGIQEDRDIGVALTGL